MRVQHPNFLSVWESTPLGKEGIPSKRINRGVLYFHVMNKNPQPTAALNKLFLLQEKLETGEINRGVWIIYFSDLPVDKVPGCEDCAAFRVCPYHHDLEPIECFSNRTRHFR